MLNQRLKSALPRIAMISTHGYVAAQPPLGAIDTGGQVVYVLELSKKLAALGFEVDIWTRRFEDQREIEPVTPGVRILRARCGGRKFVPKEYLYEHLPEWSANVRCFLDAHRIRYQFLNSHYWDAGIAARDLSEVFDVPHLHTPHSLGVWKSRQVEVDYPGDEHRFERQYNFANRIYHEQQIYSSVDMVLATSLPQKELLLNEYHVPPERCRVLPPGYDPARFYPVAESCRTAIRTRLGFSRPVIMALGRLAFNKGYDLLLQSFAFVARHEPEPILYLALGGTESTPAERRLLQDLRTLAARLGLLDRVQFGSFIPDAELANYYRAADVFVLSSRYEPFGMTALEAMACGTPIVVTTQGGLHHAVTFGRDALYADPFDSEELAQMILNVLRDRRLRSCLSRMGARKAQNCFTWTKLAQEILAITGGLRDESVCMQRAGSGAG